MRRLLQLAPTQSGLALVFLLALVGLVSPAHAAIAFVDASPSCANPGSVSSFTITHTLTNGNLAVVIVSMRTTTVSVSSITDNGTGGGSTYLHRGDTTNGTVTRVELWTTTPSGITGSPATITVNLSGASKVIGCSGQYSGVLAFGAVMDGTGSSTTPSTSSTLSNGSDDRIMNANNFVVAGFASQGTATYSANTGNLRRSAVSSGGAAASNVGGALADNTNASAGNKATSTATLSASNAWASVSMELKGVATTGDLVQFGYAWPAVSSTIALTFGKPNTAGNLIVVTANWDSNVLTASVTDSKGNTYSSAVGPITYCGTGDRDQIFFAKNIAGGGINTVTVTFSGVPPAVNNASIAEFANQDTVSPLDVTASASGTSTTPDSGSATTTAANELIYGVIDLCAASAVTPGAGFTGAVDTGENQIAMMQYKAVTSTGAFKSDGTLGTSVGWLAMMATFKNASQPGGQKKRLPLLGVG